MKFKQSFKKFVINKRISRNIPFEYKLSNTLYRNFTDNQRNQTSSNNIISCNVENIDKINQVD
jgi:hypothetical protein